LIDDPPAGIAGLALYKQNQLAKAAADSSILRGLYQRVGPADFAKIVSESGAAAGLVKDLLWFYATTPLSLAEAANLARAAGQADRIVFDTKLLAEVEAQKELLIRQQTLAKQLHFLELGLEPELTKDAFNLIEAEEGAQLEKQPGGKLLRRYSTRALDWIDPKSGQTYDAVGSFAQGTKYDFKDFLASFRSHFLKKVDKVVLDMRGLTDADRATMLSDIIPNLSSAERDKLIILTW
jgi:hypothetical protein